MPTSPIVYYELPQLLELIDTSSDWDHSDFDWVRIIDRYLEYDTSKMKRLLTSISERGFLSEGAINVYRNGYDTHCYCTGGYVCRSCNRKGWELANGHHRFATAILLAVPKVPVIFEEVTWPDHLWTSDLAGPLVDPADHLWTNDLAGPLVDPAG